MTKREKIKVMTPVKEELFANKFTTMFSRSGTYLNPRDVFDVYSILQEEFDRELFIDLVAFEIMLMEMSYSTLKQCKEQLTSRKPSGRIEHLIKGEFIFEDIISDVLAFSEIIIQEISEYEIDNIIKHFYTTGELDLEMFKFKDQLHLRLPEHPQLQWLRKKYKKS